MPQGSGDDRLKFRLHLQGICANRRRAMSLSLNAFKSVECAHTAETLLLERAAPEGGTTTLG